ncbi:hypothetical protein BMS3Abin07_00121 [bacterium BMS3Abin07]|nr:hypothetical protein BMS3Abin07_00121 [bacterium BMS3Abin07]GBE32930.1 hypothetical protein BMS3Bbin05_01860 [bacterium BMS3Bbin05]
MESSRAMEKIIERINYGKRSKGRHKNKLLEESGWRFFDTPMGISRHGQRRARGQLARGTIFTLWI